jgi:tetratricopeptide (TPR) repeat protein
VSDRLRPLWDFDDLDASEERFRAQLDAERSDEGRAEVLTQLARVAGLRGEFDAGEKFVAEAERLAGDAGSAAVRVDLERGRLLRSSGDREAALPLFESAFAKAADAGEWYLAADAAHMAALAAPGRDGFVTWTQRGIELGEAHEEAAYWAGPLLNNLGWDHYDAGEHALALDAFERALAVREGDPGNPDGIELAHFAVGKTLRALGRAAEAIPHLEQAVVSAQQRGTRDGWYHEELALEYAAAGETDDAREHARTAIPLLERNDPSFAGDAERASRLHALAQAS